MGDPFADLLTRFKGGEPKSEIGKEEDRPLADRERGNLNSANRESSAPPSSGSLQSIGVSPPLRNSKIDDDLEKLFGNANNDDNVQGEPSSAERDEGNLDLDFDLLHITPEKPEQSVELKPVEVVDEVKDMELAKLMSLGYSIDEANASYENTVLYDDIMEETRRKNHRVRRHSQHRRSEVNWEGDNSVSRFDDSEGRESNVDLFSMASSMFNRGKEFVDQFSLFPEGEYGDVLPPSRTREPQRRQFDKPALPRRPRKADGIVLREEDDFLTRTDMKSHSQPSTNQVQEGDLLGSETDVSVVPNPPQSTETLLDFDESPVNSPSICVSASGQESIVPVVAITEIELSGYVEFKIRAGELFKMGDYVMATQEYEKSLNSLPQGHPLRIISYSNLMASQLKTGQYKEALQAGSIALDLFPKDTAQWIQFIQNSEPPRTYGDIWQKIILRQAEALEHLENYPHALKTYESLIEKNICTSKIMEGRRRCEKFLNPEKYKVTRKNLVSIEKPPVTPNPSNKKYENLQTVKDNNRKQEEEASQRHALYDKVCNQITDWEADRANDIRHLLSNLQAILTWTNWKPVSSAELVMPKKVKGTYLKAVTKTHPDKIPDSLALEKKMIAENVFSRLSLAWEKFKLENDIT